MKHICKSSNSNTVQPEENIFRPWRLCLTARNAIGRIFFPCAGNRWRKYSIRESRPFTPCLRNSFTFLLSGLLVIASTMVTPPLAQAVGIPVLVKDIRAGISGSAPGNIPILANVNGVLFFSADDGVFGSELWKSDGTAAGTVLVKDISPGVSSSGPANLTAVNGVLFFSSFGATGDVELWKSDGTAAGTVLVKNIFPGGSSNPKNLTNVNGTLFFVAQNGTPSGSGLWKSDGTAAGTVIVKSGIFFTSNSILVNVNGTLFFDADDGVNGRELWKSDGTTAGTVLVKDIRPGGGALNSSFPELLTNVNGTVFFRATEGINGRELWKSDGTAAGTVLVKDINLFGNSFPSFLTNVGGTLFFAATGNGAQFSELWKSNGSAAGTVKVNATPRIPLGPTNLTNVNGTLFFAATNNLNGIELWKSDAVNTVMVKDIHPAGGFRGHSNPQFLTNIGGSLFFQANDGVTGLELWTSDGTAPGTVLVKDILAGAASSFPFGLTDVNGSLFFYADDGLHGLELWTLAGLQPPAPTTPTPGSSANCFSCGTDAEPINTFSGELFEPLSPDINLGGPMPLTFQRYYAAFLRRSFVLGDLGNNWRHNFDARLFISGNTAKYVSWKGRVTNFIKNLGTGIWVQQDNLDTTYKLTKPASQNAALFDPQDNLIYTFDFVTSSLIAGKLATVEDGKGNVHTVTYNAAGQIQTVSDGLGRTLTFTHNADAIPKISVVSDGTRSILFQYTDPLDTENLTQFKDVRGGFTTYTYKDSTGTADHALMTQWMLPRLNVPFIQTFDAQGRVSTQTNASFEATSLAYGVPAVGQTTITDPLANNRVHTHTATGELANSKDQTGQSVIIGSDATGRRNAITDRLGDTTTMTYHTPSGKLAGVTNADGTTESFAYTPRTISGLPLHDLSGVTNADGTTISMVHDALGNVTSSTDQLGNASMATHNGKGQVLTTTNKLLGVTTNTYNADATLASSIDPAANITSYSYDPLRRPVLITHADASTRSMTFDNADHLLTTTNENGSTTTMTYDANGNLATVQDPLLNTTTYTYDGNDRLLSIIDPLGGTSSRRYDALNRIASTTDANGNITTNGYDLRSRLTSITDPLGNTWPLSYDAEAIIAFSADPLGNTTTYVSDKMGRITQITSPLGAISQISYDAMGRLATTTDALNQITTLSRDARGQLSGVALPGGISAAYTRNAMGEITSITDPGGNSWNRGYDVSGRLTSSTDPLNRVKTTAYDSRNRPRTITFPGALGTQTLSYNGTGNLTGVSHTDGTTFGYSYDADSRMSAANDGGATPNNMTRSYDANGRVSNSNGIAITHDPGDRLTAMTLATGKTVAYTWDANNHVTSVTDWLGGVTTFSYDNAGRLTGITRPNGVNTTNTWDNDSHLIGISEGAISSITLTRDAKGQITAAARTVPTMATASGISSKVLGYDAASQVAGNGYDALGRQLAAGADTFSWDAASRLTGYTAGGVTATHVYDALGRRTRRTAGAVTTDYVWNDALVLASVSVERRGGDFRYFIHTPGGTLLYSIDAATNARSFFHYDEMGNTIFVSNDTGAVIGSYAYTPYGELIAATGALDNPFTWQGKYGVMDEGNGLYYIRSRYYDSASGRFISRDPVNNTGPKSINPYQYAFDNPMQLVDATGKGSVLEDVGATTVQVIGTGLNGAAAAFGAGLSVGGDLMTLAATFIGKNGDVDAGDVFNGGGGALVADTLAGGLVVTGSTLALPVTLVAVGFSSVKVAVGVASEINDSFEQLEAARIMEQVARIRFDSRIRQRQEDFARRKASREAAVAARKAAEDVRIRAVIQRFNELDNRTLENFSSLADEGSYHLGYFAELFLIDSDREAPVKHAHGRDNSTTFDPPASETGGGCSLKSVVDDLQGVISLC